MFSSFFNFLFRYIYNKKTQDITIDTEYKKATNIEPFNKNEISLLSDNYAKFGVTELNDKPCDQEYKFYTDSNGLTVLTGEDTRNIFEEFKKK